MSKANRMPPMWALCRLGVPGLMYYVLTDKTWCADPRKASQFSSKFQAKRARTAAFMDPAEVVPVEVKRE